MSIFFRRNRRSDEKIIPAVQIVQAVPIFSDSSRKVAMFYIFAVVISLLASFQLSLAAESGKYPPPRFPSYVRPPKNIEDVMPFARAAVRQTGGRTPLGLVEKGQAVAIFSEPMAEDMILQAIRRAYEERGVKVQIVSEYQLLGVSKEEAMKAVKANRWFTSEQGYMEAAA
jgi:hypothetical protein